MSYQATRPIALSVPTDNPKVDRVVIFHPGDTVPENARGFQGLVKSGRIIETTGETVEVAAAAATGEPVVFDPAEATADEVIAYLKDADDAEVARIKALEGEGKNRKTILEFEK